MALVAEEVGRGERDDVGFVVADRPVLGELGRRDTDVRRRHAAELVGVVQDGGRRKERRGEQRREARRRADRAVAADPEDDDPRLGRRPVRRGKRRAPLPVPAASTRGGAARALGRPDARVVVEPEQKAFPVAVRRAGLDARARRFAGAELWGGEHPRARVAVKHFPERPRGERVPPDAVAEALDGGEAPKVRRADRAHPADVVLVDRGDHVRGERGHARRHARHTVQHDNAPHAPRERGEEPLRAPRAQQPDADHADLGAPGDLAEHHPPRGVRGSPHRDDDRGRIRRAGVLKEAARALPPLPPNGSLDVCNRLFHAARDSVKDLVAGLKKRPVLPRHHRPRAVSGVRNGRRRRAADHGVGGARCRGGGCRAAALGTGNAVQREQAHRRELVRELHPLHAVDDRVRKTVRRDVGERRVELRVGDGLGDQHGRVREVGDGPEVAVVGLDGHRLPRERAVDQVEDEREPRPADLGEHGEHQEQPL